MSRDSKKAATPVAAGCIVVGVATAAFAATRVWWSAGDVDTPAGPREVTATGAATLPELIPVALVALAGLGAALATRGIARRVVATLIAAAGLLIAIRSIGALSAAPTTALTTAIGQPHGEATVHPVAPVMAIVGGLLITAGGLILAVRRASSGGLGRRYERGRPADPTHSGAGSGASSSEGPTAVSDADLWKAMDAGADPTADPSAAATPDPALGTGKELGQDLALDPPTGSTGSDRPASGG